MAPSGTRFEKKGPHTGLIGHLFGAIFEALAAAVRKKCNKNCLLVDFGKLFEVISWLFGSKN